MLKHFVLIWSTARRYKAYFRANEVMQILIVVGKHFQGVAMTAPLLLRDNDEPSGGTHVCTEKTINYHTELKALK